MTAIAALAGLTLVLAAFLVFASRKLRVDEDPRVDAVEAMLPQINCGACGFPGCRAFADAVVRGEASPGACTVAAEEERARIASWLGVAVGGAEKRVARLACAGGSNVARVRAHYRGLASCRAATQVAGGGKSCFWGCLGFGDCADACSFTAIEMDPHGIPVVDEARCTACGDCVEVCPKDLFSLHPVSHRLWVACASLEAGDAQLADCEVACTACGRCAQDAPEWIAMRDNLAVVDYRGPHRTQVPIQRCPTGAIVWIDPEGGIVKGAAARRRVLRKSALPAAST